MLDSEDKIIEYDIPQPMIVIAKEKAKRLGTLNNSIREGKGNLVGFLGEELVAFHLNEKVTNTYDYDIIHDTFKIDVKTKECTSPPKLDYECSISDYNPNQKCDFYIFVRISNDLTKGWILGIKQKQDYFERAIKYKKGDKDLSNGFTFHCDTYNLPIRELDSIGDIFGY